MGIFYGLTQGLGLSLDEIPHIIPEFSQSPRNRPVPSSDVMSHRHWSRSG